MIKAATKLAESFCNKRFASQQIAMWLDYFPFSRSNDWWDGVKDGTVNDLYKTSDEIIIPLGPIISLEALKTFDDADTEYTMDPSLYYVDKNGDFPKIVLRNGQIWPVTVLRRASGIKIEMTVGHSTVPDDIILAVKMIIAKMYENRGDSKDEESFGQLGFVIPPTAASILSTNRQFRL